MGDFFKEWKRKLGLLTLVMACVAMVGWVRSITITDNIDLPLRGRTVDAIESAHGELFLVRSKIEVEQEVSAGA